MVDPINPHASRAQLQNNTATSRSGNNQPQEGDIQQQEGNVQPHEGDAQPQEGNIQPHEGDTQPQEGNVQPQGDGLQNQIPQSTGIRRLQPRELRLIDEAAREKALQFMRNRRELMGDSPLVIRPFENEYEAKRRTHAAEMHMYNLVLKDYLVKLQDEARSDTSGLQATEPGRTQSERISDLESQVAELKRELDTRKDLDTSNQASSSQG